MSELAERLLRALQQSHRVGDAVGLARLASLDNHQATSPHAYESAMNELAGYGYVAARPGGMWAILAFDARTSCAVCSQFAPKLCPGCQMVFCDEHYAAHREDNAVKRARFSTCTSSNSSC